MIDKRPVRQILSQQFFERRRMLSNRLPEKSIIRAVARHFTTGILILAISVATGILLDRGWICYSK